MRDQVDEDAKNADAVYIRRKLEERELEAGKDSKKTVNARDLVEDQRQRNQLSARLQADEAKESLIVTVSAHDSISFSPLAT